MALVKGRNCPKCGAASLATGDEPDELKCLQCSKIVYLHRPLQKNGQSNGHQPQEPKGPLFQDWEKNIILDALSEQYLRAKGNIRRSQLEMTQRINQEKVDKLGRLMEKIKEL